MSEVFAIIIIYLLAKLTLDVLQIQTIRTAVIDKQSSDLMGLSKDDIDNSRLYNISKLRLSIIRNIIYVSWMLYLLFGGFISSLNVYLENYALSIYFHNLYIILLVLLCVHLTMIPLSYYSTFVIETKYGFNTSTKKLFLLDNLISIIMISTVVIIVSSIFFYIVKFQEIWWLLMSLTIFTLIIVSVYVYPSYISPIFNKFVNLSDENIKNEIQDLSYQTDFSIKNLYVMDKSKRTKHPNAYFTGFKNNRRIVFYDTLLDLLSPREIKAVLAHEIGHYKHNHVVKSLILSTITIFLGMYFLSLLINDSSYLEFLNLPYNESSQLIALVYTYQVISFFIDPMFSVFSRMNEYEADNFASNQVDKEYLISSLVKLYKSNLSFLIPNKLYAIFYFSHPTVLERIYNLRSNNEAR
tara:strand:- start:2859 stop:4091 length:1233 start_codon:yes stop_codon:yes gene_type:complete